MSKPSHQAHLFPRKLKKKSNTIGLDFNHIDHCAVITGRFDPKELPSMPETNDPFGKPIRDYRTFTFIKTSNSLDFIQYNMLLHFHRI